MSNHITSCSETFLSQNPLYSSLTSAVPYFSSAALQGSVDLHGPSSRGTPPSLHNEANQVHARMRLTLVPSKPPLSIDSPFGYIPGPVMPPSPPSFFTGRILAEDGSTGTGTPTTYSANLPPLSTSLTQELLQNYVMEHNAQVSCLSTNIMAAAGPGYFPACSSRLMFPPPPPQPPRPTITLPPLTLEELLASPIVSPVGEEPQPSGSLPVSEHGVIYPGQVLPPTQAPTQVEGQQHGSMVRNQSMDTIISSAVTPSSLITGSYPAAGIEPPPCPRVNLLGEAVPHGSTHMLQGTAGMTNPIVPFMTQPISGLPVDPLMLNFSGPPICAPPPEPVPMPPCPSPSIYGGLSPLKRGDSADLQQLYAAFMNEEEILMPFTEGAGQQPLSPGGAAVAGQQTGVKRQTRESTPPSPRSHRLRNKKRAVEESVGPKTPDNGAQAVGVVETAAAAASLAEGKTSGAAERSRSKAVNVPGHTKALLFVKDKAGDKEILREVQCEHLFGKVVTSTDCGRLARIVLPRAEVERFFPPCDNRNGVGITLWDTCGRSFTCVLKYWLNGRPVPKRMWLLDKCQSLISGLDLTPGTQIDFFRSKDGQFVVVPQAAP